MMMMMMCVDAGSFHVGGSRFRGRDFYCVNYSCKPNADRFAKINTSCRCRSLSLILICRDVRIGKKKGRKKEGIVNSFGKCSVLHHKQPHLKKMLKCQQPINYPQS